MPRTSALIGTRPVSCLDSCQFHEVPCSLERQPAHRRAEPNLKGNPRRARILHRKEDKLREQRRCRCQRWLGCVQLESASKASTGKQMPPTACWKRAQKLSLAGQRLRQVVKWRPRGKLQLRAAKASMLRNAQLRRDKALALGEPNLCKWAFANTCRTKLCCQFHAAEDQPVVAEIVSCSASIFSIDGHQTPLMFWQRPTSHICIHCLAHWRSQAAFVKCAAKSLAVVAAAVRGGQNNS